MTPCQFIQPSWDFVFLRLRGVPAEPAKFVLRRLGGERRLQAIIRPSVMEQFYGYNMQPSMWTFSVLFASDYQPLRRAKQNLPKAERNSWCAFVSFGGS
jgi:hypothetical protein